MIVADEVLESLLTLPLSDCLSDHVTNKRRVVRADEDCERYVRHLDLQHCEAWELLELFRIRAQEALKAVHGFKGHVEYAHMLSPAWSVSYATEQTSWYACGIDVAGCIRTSKASEDVLDGCAESLVESEERAECDSVHLECELLSRHAGVVWVADAHGCGRSSDSEPSDTLSDFCWHVRKGRGGRVGHIASVWYAEAVLEERTGASEAVVFQGGTEKASVT